MHCTVITAGDDHDLSGFFPVNFCNGLFDDSVSADSVSVNIQNNFNTGILQQSISDCFCTSVRRACIRRIIMNSHIMNHADSGSFQLFGDGLADHDDIFGTVCCSVVKIRIISSSLIRFKALCGMGMHNQHLGGAVFLNPEFRQELTFFIKCLIGKRGLILYLSGFGEMKIICSCVSAVGHLLN